MSNILSGLLIASAFVLSSAAQVPQSIQKMAKNQCAACHGQNGISSNSQWPNLAGQKKQYLVLQLNAFKTGSRKNTLMTPQAKMLSDKQAQQLAEYYSNLPACP